MIETARRLHDEVLSLAAQLERFQQVTEQEAALYDAKVRPLFWSPIRPTELSTSRHCVLTSTRLDTLGSPGHAFMSTPIRCVTDCVRSKG